MIPGIFSDHNTIRLDVNYRKKKIQIVFTLLDNQQITDESKKEIKICIETNENENMTTQNRIQ